MHYFVSSLVKTNLRFKDNTAVLKGTTPLLIVLLDVYFLHQTLEIESLTG